MQRLKNFVRDTGHLWIVFLLIAAGGAAFFLVRGRLVPESYGVTGPYRGAALEEIAARPSTWHSDATCHECHQKVADERADSLHKSVRCFHCHGAGREHVTQARLAAKTPGTKIPPASEWDGDFLTKLDLYVTKDRATCLSCHQEAVGMPASFRKIDVAEHLESMGASEPDSREACFECHQGHNTKP